MVIVIHFGIMDTFPGKVESTVRVERLGIGVWLGGGAQSINAGSFGRWSEATAA